MKLEDMSWEDLQDYGTWEVMHAFARGEKLKTVVWRIIDLALMWKRATDEKAKHARVVEAAKLKRKRKR